jgi:D-amino peptidase
MRIFISIDMEGVAGITSESHRTPDTEDYKWGRELMLAEANAAIAGAFDAGAKQVLINDSHNTMDNLLPQGLDGRATCITGSYKPLSMMEGISDKFDAALFIGYHAMRGTPEAVMDHTYSEQSLDSVRINGVPAGETLVNGLAAGAFGVPLVVVSGDLALKKEVQKISAGIESVVVKRGITRYCAECDPPELACKKIRDGVSRALSQNQLPKPLTVRKPVRFELDFPHTHMAELCTRMPGVARKGGRTITFKQNDYLTAFRQFLALTSIARG